MLPPASTYSADSSHSSMVAEMPALEQHGLAHVPQLAQQREVLHVARADLVDVDVAVHQLDLAEVHHLGHELQVVLVRRRRAAAAGLPRRVPGSCTASCVA